MQRIATQLQTKRYSDIVLWTWLRNFYYICSCGSYGMNFLRSPCVPASRYKTKYSVPRYFTCPGNKRNDELKGSFGINTESIKLVIIETLCKPLCLLAQRQFGSPISEMPGVCCLEDLDHTILVIHRQWSVASILSFESVAEGSLRERFSFKLGPVFGVLKDITGHSCLMRNISSHILIAEKVFYITRPWQKASFLRSLECLIVRSHF